MWTRFPTVNSGFEFVKTLLLNTCYVSPEDVKMALVEMGPIAGSVMRMFGIGAKKKPLFTRETPRVRSADLDGQTRRLVAPAPLNAREVREQNDLRGLRNALHADAAS